MISPEVGSMAVRKIVRMGHPVLRQPAAPLTPDAIASDETRRLIAIIEIPDTGSRYGDMPAMPLSVFINPSIEVLDPETHGFWEGCLSVPGMRGFVERPQQIRVDYLDLEGRPQSLELNGFAATVFQHEFDHLDGKLYIDRMTDTRLLAFEEEFVRYLAPREDTEIID
jgi:peptide deformylase